jgi:hypothetical protein
VLVSRERRSQLEPDRHRAIDETFRARADAYDREACWVTDESVIRPLVPEVFGEASLLDAAAGTAVVGRAAEAVGWRVVAADLSRDMLRQSVPISSVQSRLPHLPLKDGCVDVVVCRQGMQYCELEATLFEFQRVSRCEVRLGHITMESVEDREVWQAYFDLASPGRRHIFAPGQIEKQCQSSGLSVVSTSVIRTRSGASGTVRHLGPAAAAMALETIRDAPGWWQSRYEVTPTAAGDDFEYNHRWEFVVATIDGWKSSSDGRIG